MAYITGKKTVFFVTSPRSPAKLSNEIKFLIGKFSGKKWNTHTQREFYLALAKQDFFEGSPTGDIAFKARDRINRAPKSLGLVKLTPFIELTDAGNKYLFGKRPEEIFLRQLLKFQLPSINHIDKKKDFNIKPYLELMRLIRELGNLSKIEIALFVVQLTNFSNFELIKSKIENFRIEAKDLRTKKINYKKFIQEKFVSELTNLFKEEIEEGDISTRESMDISLEKFIKTKKANHIDYADASIRYLRATGLFTINPRTSKINVIPEKIRDLDYILKNTPRQIFSYDDKEDFERYLFNPILPPLLTDDRELLIEKIKTKDSEGQVENLEAMSVEELKDHYYAIVDKNLKSLVSQEKEQLKTYQEYGDIQKVFDSIVKKEIIDPPLFLEWNVWRAFAMLNDGDIVGNFKIDDDGVPLYTAAGNISDIVCKYKDFDVIVEVTLSSGQKQYEMEGEPVARHYGDHKILTGKDVYCIFIAPQLNAAAIALFYLLHKTNIERYGGKPKIIPVSLTDFKKLLTNAFNSGKKPNSEEFRKLWSELSDLASKVNSEVEWSSAISAKIKTAFTDII